MQNYMHEYRRPRQDFNSQLKLQIMRSLKGSLEDLIELLGFTIDDIEVQLDKQESASLYESTLKDLQTNKNSSAKDVITASINEFELMLEVPSMTKLKKIISQKHHL